MIKISDVALERLKELFQNTPKEKDVLGLRLVALPAEDENYQLAFSLAKGAFFDEDVVDLESMKLFVPKEEAEILEGATLHYRNKIFRVQYPPEKKPECVGCALVEDCHG